jgi:hypothetical protein
MNTNMIILICGLVVLCMCTYMLYLTKKIENNYISLTSRIEKLERGVRIEEECIGDKCNLDNKRKKESIENIRVNNESYNMSNNEMPGIMSFMSGMGLPNIFGHLNKGNYDMSDEVIEEESQTSNDLLNDIERLKEELGDEEIEDEDSEDLRNLVEENKDNTELSKEKIDEEILSNGRVIKNNFNVMSQFDELDDVEESDNNELERYMNNIRESNVDIDLEKHLAEQPDTVSSMSLSAIQQLTEPFANASIEVKVNIIANNWKLSDLKDLCKKNNIAQNGNKQILVKRLIEKFPEIFEKELPKEKNVEEQEINN